MARQHRDDILDFIGAPEAIGKPVLLDLLSGQSNIVLSHALTKVADQSICNTIAKYFGMGHIEKNATKRYEEIQQEVLLALRQSGSLAFASRVVQDYCIRAVNALSELPLSPAKDSLARLIGHGSNQGNSFRR